jgi:hypothetical protein
VDSRIHVLIFCDLHLNMNVNIFRNRDKSVYITTRMRVERSGNESSIPGSSRDSFLYPRAKTGSGAKPVSYPIDKGITGAVA